MSAVDDLFRDLRRQGKKALVPFVTAGDPDLDFTVDVLKQLAEYGSLCEVGIPYSDPIADGPVIQASYTRALADRIRLEQIWEALQRATNEVTAPIVTMVSYAIVYRQQPEAYVAEAKRRGIAGAIVPDLPIDEADRFATYCRQHDFSLIQLVTPTTPRDRARRIAENSSGFLYYVSVAGITGERTELPPDLIDNVGWLATQTELPICIGFGISGPDQARQLGAVADGIIVGSAFVRRIAEEKTRGRDAVLRDIGQFAQELSHALNG